MVFAIKSSFKFPALAMLHEVERVMKDGELKHARFWAADGKRKWAIFYFNLPSHNHIHIAKYLFSFRDE